MADLASFEQKFAPVDVSEELAETIKKKPSFWQHMQSEMQKMFVGKKANGQITKDQVSFENKWKERRSHK